jgi:hypothetical protein
MNIELHIERLVLDGLPVTVAQAKAVQAAVEAELIRRLGSVAARPNSPAGVALARVTDETLRLTGREQPADLGRHIARSVQGSIAGTLFSAASPVIAPSSSVHSAPAAVARPNVSPPERSS